MSKDRTTAPDASQPPAPAAREATPPQQPTAPRRTAPWRRGVAVVLFLGLVGTAAYLGQPDPKPIAVADFRMVEVAREVGLVFEHKAGDLDPKIQHIQPHILGVGAAVSVSDVDGDGDPDLYVTNSAFGAPNALFLNQGDGTFVEGARAAGIADLNVEGRGLCMGSIFGDVDNDGDEDLFVYRYGYTAFFLNNGDGTFTDHTAASGLERWMYSNAATWIDVDRDGFLDLFVGGYYREEIDLWNIDDTSIMHDSQDYASNGGRNYFFKGRGDGTFEDVSDRYNIGGSRWTMACSIADFDRDGWMDLYVANDYNGEQLFRNALGTHFEETDVGLGHDSKSGMSVHFGNVRNDGRFSVFVTNISRRGYVFHGNNLRENRVEETGQLVQTARGAAIDTGWAWGARFADFDNDGLEDLFVVNGFVSANPDRDYWYYAGKLATGSGRIIADAANWTPFEDRSQSGFERSVVLRNQGRGSFEDVAEVVGVTDLLDGRAIVTGDFRGVGALDVVIANQKGPLLYYRNSPKPDNNWISLSLTGTRSNRSAIGAEVVLEWGNQIALRVVEGGGGFSSQSDRRLFWGLGEHSGPVRARVLWPSGRAQVLEDLASGRLHHIEEPAAD